jgi:hypothetical protein
MKRPILGVAILPTFGQGYILKLRFEDKVGDCINQNIWALDTVLSFHLGTEILTDEEGARDVA